jgi:uncharacterized protein
VELNNLGKLAGGRVALSLLCASVPARAADYVPIDCSKASSPAERTICRSYPLGAGRSPHGDLVRLVTSLVAMGQRSDIGNAQRKWLEERDACADDAACIARAYQSHIAALSATLDVIASHGPF